MQLLNKTISIREVQRQYKAVAESVQKSKKPIIVMNRSQAQLALINLKQLEEYERLKNFAFLEELRSNNRNFRFDDAFSDITAEVESVRQRQYEKTSSSI
ncbi:MAG: hypothetical protein WDZ94_02865 [Patescibacteria group bacterium]